MADKFDNNEVDGEGPEDQFAREQAPAVSAPPAKNLIFFGGVMLIGAVLIYVIFLSTTSSSPKKPSIPSAASIIEPPSPVPFTPELPKPPETNIVPPEPPPIDGAEKPVNIGVGDDPEVRKRLQSNLLAVGGGLFGGEGAGGVGLGGGTNNEVYGAANDNDPSVSFADSFFNQKNVPNAFARKLGDTARLITQGKIIEAVLETPINTDVPGMIRGVVSRDIYAESGRAILIPKGSRLVGSYNNFIIRGNKRVTIIWSRVIRPDGIDIMIRSPGTDQLGRAGAAGDVDNKYLEIFSTAFLVSAINLGVGLGADAVNNETATTTRNTDGSTTSTSTATNDAALRAVDMFGNAGVSLVQGFINTKPTITIDQGTRISVFVNRDLVFPSGLAGQIRFIQ